jgi:hypothetical protein
MELVVGGRRLERRLQDVEDLLSAYRTDDGLRYLDYESATPTERLVPDDLAVTILINSRATGRAFKSVQDHGAEVDLAALPDRPLEETGTEERDAVADVIARVANWAGFGASIATKVLHKKRPALIPILDNEAIFGSYMNPKWPAERARRDTVKGRSRIREALEWIAVDLTRPENHDAWLRLNKLEPGRSRIELFDMIWWTHFRRLQPVRG